jgi:hypothetical protein
MNDMTHNTRTGMRFCGWAPPTFDPDEAIIARFDPWMMSPGTSPTSSGLCHDITYDVDVAACWPEALAMLRNAHQYGYHVHGLMLDGRWGLEPCELERFDDPPDVVKVYETSSIIELTWI